MLRMNSTLSATLRTRAFHTSLTRSSDREGVFGRFNPWAKKTVAQDPSENDTMAAPIAPTFDVSFEDAESVPSWKNKELIQDPDLIETSVRNIVLEHIGDAPNTHWKDLTLEDANTKFKIVKESIKQVGKEVPNLELNNMLVVNDLVEFLKRKVQDKTKPSIQLYFEENAASLPTNLTFEPSSKVKL